MHRYLEEIPPYENVDNLMEQVRAYYKSPMAKALWEKIAPDCEKALRGSPINITTTTSERTTVSQLSNFQQAQRNLAMTQRTAHLEMMACLLAVIGAALDE